MRSHGIWAVVLAVCAACSGQPADRSGMTEELQSRELKRALPAEIMAKGDEIGQAAVNMAQSTLQAALGKALSEGGVPNAIQYCNLAAYPLMKQWEDSLGLKIRRVTDRTRNPADRLSEVEMSIFEAYLAAEELPGSQIQELDEQHLILTKPIPIGNAMCLQCHGTPGKELAVENHALIRKLYPQDQAINYELGQLRGMWSVVIPRKKVIEQL